MRARLRPRAFDFLLEAPTGTPPCPRSSMVEHPRVLEGFDCRETNIQPAMRQPESSKPYNTRGGSTQWRHCMNGSQSTRLSRHVIAVAAAAALAALSGCGGDDDTPIVLGAQAPQAA